MDGDEPATSFLSKDPIIGLISEEWMSGELTKIRNVQKRIAVGRESVVIERAHIVAKFE